MAKPTYQKTDQETYQEGVAHGQELTPSDELRYNALKYAKDNNIELPLSATTESALIHQMEALAQKGFWGEKVRDSVQQAYNTLQEKNLQLTDTLVGQRPDIQAVTEMVQTKFKDYQNTFHEE